MGNTFANKKFVGQCIVAEDDGTLINQSGSFPFKRGEIIFRPFSGDAEVFSEDWFKENFIQVDVKKVSKVDLDEIAKAYKQEWVNDEDYIFEPKLISDEQC